ncbi:MAG: hypothetical protein HPY53_09620 [Brevinematales bacterium]|nr:hypothetical protein [Brevinematales bacterium]
MKALKYIIASVVILALVYFGLMGVIHLILDKNKTAIETQIADVLGVQKVNIEGFMNLPFISVEANGFSLVMDDGSYAYVDSAVIRYSVLRYLQFGGIAAAITGVKVGSVSLFSTIPQIQSMIDALQRGETNSDAKPSPIESINVDIHSVNVKLGLIGKISSDLNIKDIRLEFKPNRLSIFADMKANVFLSTNIEYLNADTSVAFEFTDLSNRIGTGKLDLNDIDFGGMKLFSEQELRFAMQSNDISFDWDDPALSNFITVEKDSLTFKLSRPFLIDNKKYAEYNLFEYIFPTNQYVMETSVEYRNDKFTLITAVKSTDLKKTFGEMTAYEENERFYVKGYIDTPKYGLIKADVYFKKDAQLPDGTVEMHDIAFMDGLKFGGLATVVSASNSVTARIKGLQMNGGTIGNAGVTITIQTNGIVDIKSLKGSYQAFVDGAITNTDFRIQIRLKEALGAFVVKNIHMDFFNLGKGKYNGNAVLYTKDEVFYIDGDLQGYYAGGKIIDTTVRLSNSYLNFYTLNFPKNQIFLKGGLDFNSPDKIHTIIKFSGDLNWVYRHYLPTKGIVTIDNDKGMVNGRFDLGGLISVGIYGTGPWLNVGINLHSYPMKRFDFPGFLSGQADLRFYAGSLWGVKFDLDYPLDKNNKFKLVLRSEKKKGGGDIMVDHCALTLNEDTLLSTTGWMNEDGKRLKGKIEFVRGFLTFDASYDDIFGSMSIHDFGVKNLIKKGQDYYLTLGMTFRGKLTDPDMHGSALVYQIVSSPNTPKKTILTVEDLSKVNNVYSAQNLRYYDRDFSFSANGKMILRKDGMYVSANGKISLLGTIDGIYDLVYNSKNDNQTLSYRINSIKMNEISMGAIEGGVIVDGNQYKFYRLANKNGVNGIIIDKGGQTQVNLDILSEKISGTIVYNVKNNKVESSAINLSADLKLFSFLKFLRKIDGKAQLNLTASGSGSDPQFNGELKISDFSVVMDYTKTAIQNQNITLSIQKSKIIFKNEVLPTTSGDMVLNGYIDTSHIPISYIDVQISPQKNKLAEFILDVDTPLMKIQGNLKINTVRVYGNPPVLNLTGDVVAQNLFLSIGLNGGGGGGPSTDPYDLFARLKWNLPIKVGNGVRFANQLIDTTLVSGEDLTILGSLWDNTFTLKGEVSVTRGTFSYIGRDFMIQTGVAKFSGKPGYPLPFISLNTLSRYKDADGENIEVFLTFEGDITDIKLKDFYSIPDRPKSDLYGLLGFENTAINTTNEAWSEVGKKLVVSGIGMADDILIFNPISMAMRKTLGLDFFMIRSGIVETMTKGMLYGSTNLDPLSLIGGTSFSMGKYLFSNLFLEYEITLERDPLSQIGIKTTHSVGLLFDFYNFNFGGHFQPIVDAVKSDNYEFTFEFNVHQKF